MDVRKNSNGEKVDSCIAGFDFVELGTIQQSATRVDPAYHVDCRVYGDLEALAEEVVARQKTTKVVVGGVQVTTGLKAAPGYLDERAGVSLVEPITPRHEWC